MTVADKLNAGFNRITKEAGQIIKVQYYTQVYDDVYDEPEYLMQSGTSQWLSGIVFPLKNEQGSKDYILQEQGLLAPEDMKLFVSGNLMFTGSENPAKIQLGSPSGDKYEILNINIENWKVSNQSIFKKGYIRRLQTGSLIGETGWQSA